MFDTQREFGSKEGIVDPGMIIEEYSDVVESLKQELHLCKTEQENIRTELVRLQNDNCTVHDIQDAFLNIHSNECNKQEFSKEEVANLQERITILQVEKESAIQLWQLSLQTIKSLEDDLKGNIFNEREVKYYQDQTHNVKASYSEAVATLETKLAQSKERLIKQLAICQTHKERLEDATRERNDIVQKFAELQKDAQDKDKNNLVTIETLKRELSDANGKAKKVMQTNLELERQLGEMKKFAENIMTKDKETKVKMSEALELVDSAIREKDLAFHREALILEEKNRLEKRLNTIASEYDARIRDLDNRSKEEHERSMKSYLTEINDLKFQLREKTALLERTQQDFKSSVMEHEKIKSELENALRKSNAKLEELEGKLKEAKEEMHFQDNTKNQAKINPEIKSLKQKIALLETRLFASNDKLKKIEYEASVSQENRNRETERRTADAFGQYLNLENQLTKTLGDKEDLVLQLKSLKHDFDYEIQKRDNDRHFLENRIRELEINLQKVNHVKEVKQNSVETNCPGNTNIGNDKRTFDIVVENKCDCGGTVLSERINELKERFHKKTKELMHHVQVHQKLSKRWRDEAKSLTLKFQGKTKELKLRLIALQNERSCLTNELLACKEELAQYKIQEIQKYNEGSRNR